MRHTNAKSLLENEKYECQKIVMPQNNNSNIADAKKDH